MVSLRDQYLIGSEKRATSSSYNIPIALFLVIVWPHEMELWFRSWYRGRVETLDYKIILYKFTLNSTVVWLTHNYGMEADPILYRNIFQ